MKFTSLLTAGALASTLVSPAIMAADTASASLSDAQKKEIEKVIHDYLINNPEVLLEASQALQQKQQQNMQQQAQAAIQENAEQVFQGKLTTVGNPKGNVTLVEFFDYQCIHCKKWHLPLKIWLKKTADYELYTKNFQSLARLLIWLPELLWRLACKANIRLCIML